jgi:hypothetical protein
VFKLLSPVDYIFPLLVWFLVRPSALWTLRCLLLFFSAVLRSADRVCRCWSDRNPTAESIFRLPLLGRSKSCRRLFSFPCRSRDPSVFAAWLLRSCRPENKRVPVLDFGPCPSAPARYQVSPVSTAPDAWFCFPIRFLRSLGSAAGVDSFLSSFSAPEFRPARAGCRLLPAAIRPGCPAQRATRFSPLCARPGSGTISRSRACTRFCSPLFTSVFQSLGRHSCQGSRSSHWPVHPDLVGLCRLLVQ